MPARRRCAAISASYRAERFLDGIGQLTFGLAATVRTHVMPEERVQYMSGEMKGEVFLQLVDGREITFLPSFGQFLERRVRAGDVARMVFVVMKLEEPRRVMRFERRVVIR